MKPFQLIVEHSEAEIRAGRAAHAAKELQKINAARVPREWRQPLANICRRAGLLNLGMRLLTPIVHPERARSGVVATNAELAEYGVLLHRIGATREALQTLERVNTLEVPDALLYRSFCHFSEWEYSGATHALEAFIAQTPPSGYMSLVARVNLASAYVGEERYEEALHLLAQNIEEARAGSNARLQGNCHEMRAQVHLHRRDFAEARRELALAADLLGASQTFDRFFVSKWSAIADGLEMRDLVPILTFREEAARRADWESVREADRFALLIRFDENRFRHLMFGTPFTAYRERICRQLGREFNESSYLYGDPQASVMDVSTGQVDDGPAITAGRKCHQLIEVLLRDLYRPQRLGALFTELCPEEHFDLFSSPDRIHQLIRRTRRWIESEQLPIAIHEDNGFYSLQMTGPFAFLLPLDRKPVDTMSQHFHRLRSRFKPKQVFTAREARGVIELPRSTFQLFINWAIEKGHVEKFGNQRDTCYRIAA